MPYSITIDPIDGKPGKPGQVYYPLALKTVPIPTPQGSELLIKLTAAALNHRDLFLRQHLYPGVTFGVPLLADGVGIVISTGPDVNEPQSWLGKRVILNPGTGWDDAEEGPESPTAYSIMGGTKLNPKGTLQEYVTLDIDEVIEAPTHLTDAEAAALPLAGLTGWRALVTKAGAKNSSKGAAIVITGIGGGVALMVLKFAVARGVHVIVTSASEEKIKMAVALGAKGGVNYKDNEWEKRALALLPPGKKNFDAIIDGAGGNSIEKGVKLLKAGGVISVYGMTVSPKMPFITPAFLKNIEVKGSTMGSRKEFRQMIAFVNEHKIKPIISRVVQGIDNIKAIDGLFDDMKNASQFGKLVIEIGSTGDSKL
ncbi:oxidoreductase [Paracoccidioides lutzii Pb01]|uniref:Oxidoreductase n=1 Tax=Paracoccidioides lutzii (strain ATCC MYA-826 / Pb01) TaxID=502779 RepID=C1GQ34_PARBA|nr:oxidoreductase [Paracoccidioides lutzii Pb01]EEH36306.2 oxidoreductase [Paracoccidioides lutzii Pb01]